MDDEEFLKQFVDTAMYFRRCLTSKVHFMVLVRQMRVLERNWRYRILLIISGVLIFINLWKQFIYLAVDINDDIDITRDSSKPSLKALGESDFFVPKSINKIDWHNYKLINKDLERIGNGEQGRPATLSEKDKALVKALYDENGFNGALSDSISLYRSLPDLRHAGCRSKRYLESLPTVAVVVQFYNEHWRTLLRTIYSVINRSPPQLLKEIILVDDASTKDFLKENLDSFADKYLRKVEVIHLQKRSGLISARLAGAKKVTAEVIVFLDSHTEVTHNWLPPLLEPIALNYRTVVCPFIDIIAHDTFEYRKHDSGARGGFDWEFFYKRLPILPMDQKKMPEPFESPVMAGGLFAISWKFFWELGGYDPGLDIWGGEQYELSFKIWQCGGRILDAPCSCVGHIYRNYASADLLQPKGHEDFVGKNYRRVAEVWMDEYAQYLYNRRPHYRNIDPGDISEQKVLREKLNCKPFRWFITQVAFDFAVKFPPVEPEPYALGMIKPESHWHLCVDANHGKALDKLILMPCVEMWGSEQKFVFGWFKDIKTENRSMCWDLPATFPGSPVVLFTCHGEEGNQSWRYLPDKKHIVHVESDVCFAWNRSLSLFVDICDDDNKMQKWTIEKVNKEMLNKWDQNRVMVTGPVEKFRVDFHK